MNIYYFSGTGNSYSIAKRMKERLKRSTLISIPEILANSEKLVSNEEILVVSPLYYYGPPPIIYDFLDRFDNNEKYSISFIFTAEFPNGIVIDKLKHYLDNKTWYFKNLYYIKMPSNYLIKSRIHNRQKSMKLINKGIKKLDRVLDDFTNKRIHKDKEYLVFKWLLNAEKAYDDFVSDYKNYDKKFRTNEQCNNCLQCLKICPVNNITFSDDVEWLHKCSACLRCINFCPNQAIEYGSTTKGRKRYLHPTLKLKDFYMI